MSSGISSDIRRCVPSKGIEDLADDDVHRIKYQHRNPGNKAAGVELKKRAKETRKKE